jgi:hypothetical protein
VWLALQLRRIHSEYSRGSAEGDCLQRGDAGKAKVYQVEQMLRMAEALGIIQLPKEK